MTTKERLTRERSIFRVFLSAYPGAALYGVIFNVMLMIDSILAGQFLGADGIAAVTLGVPGWGLIVALIYALIHGTGLRMIWVKGSSDHDRFDKVFSGGLTFVGLLGLAFTALILLLSEPLVNLCGGDMVQENVFAGAVLYLRFCAPIAFITALAMTLQELFNVLGHQSRRAALNVINVTVNLIVSLLCMHYLPENLVLAGLGIGTSAAGIVEFLAALILLRTIPHHVVYRPCLPKVREIVETVRCGLPSATDYLAENLVMGVQNNLILAGFPGDPMILPAAEVVCNINYFLAGAIKGAAYAAEPLFAIFYIERDKIDLKQTWKITGSFGLFMAILWAGVFYLALPQLCALCGMELSEDIQRGMLLCVVFVPFVHVTYMFTLYYEAVRRFAVSIAFGVIPDSCLYVLMMAIFIPVLGKDGIWLSITGNQLIGLLLLLPAVYLLGRSAGKGPERVLLLPGHFSDWIERMKAEVHRGSDDLTEFGGGVYEQLLVIGLDRELASVTAQSVEDLAAGMIKDSDSLTVKILEERSDDAKVEIYLRAKGHPHDPLTDLMDEEDAGLKLARLHERAEEFFYTYVYKMNIVYIVLDSPLE